MILRALELAGAFVIEPERIADERGFFARTYDADEVAAAGLATGILQTSIAWNVKAGTVRGMHFQFPPYAETKLVRCTRGAIHDVIVDLRPESPTFAMSVGVRLDAENRHTLFVPERFAHGYQVLADGTEVSYAMNERYAPEHQSGIRHDDPRLGIEWPLAVGIVSERDRQLPALVEATDLIPRMAETR